MKPESALILMQQVVDNYSMNCAQEEAWQTLKAAVLAQLSHNTGSLKLPTFGDVYLSIGDIGVRDKCIDFYNEMCRQLKAGA